MIYGSVCSGIEAATVAWHPLGWTPAFFSEIEKFPRAVLQHHYPGVPLHGDFTTIGADDYGPIDLLVGGTPCQSFSIAGLRGGLDDDRGNLALEFLLLAKRKRPEWLLWENVPGVLSSNGGRDFGSILGGMGELGYRWAYRVLDAQYFGVAQRRRRVFVVGHLGDWRRSAAVLSEREGLQGDNPPSREAGKEITGTLVSRASGGGGGPEQGDGASEGFVIATHAPEVAKCLVGDQGKQDSEVETFVTHSLRGEGFDASEDGTGRGTPLVPAVAPTMMSEGDAHSGFKDEHGLVPLAFNMHKSGSDASSLGVESDMTPCLRVFDKSPFAVMTEMVVRRLTPRECERLQGFPDDYTKIPYRGKPAEECPDGPRYKALGNSMAVPVMRWIGERINQVDALLERVA